MVVTRSWLAGIFLVALIVRGVVVVAFGNLVPTMPDKTKRYDNIAMSLLRGEGFALAGRPTAVSPPVYPLMLAGVYALTGRSDQAARWALAVVDAAACVLIFVAAAGLVSRRAALLTALCAVLSPYQLYTVLVGASDTLFTFLVALALVLLLRAALRPFPLRLLLAGGAVSLATLSRAVTLLFPLAAIPALWLASPLAARAKLRSAGFVLAGAALVLTPWTVRNWQVFGRFVPVQTLGGYHLYMASLDWANPADRAEIRQARPSQADNDAHLYRVALARIVSDPLRYVGLAYRRLLSMWFGSQSGALSGTLVPVNSALLALAAFGVWLERRRLARLALPLALVLYFVAVHLVIASIFRYMLPVVPVVTMVAMIPCARLLERVAERRA